MASWRHNGEKRKRRHGGIASMRIMARLLEQQQKASESVSGISKRGKRQARRGGNNGETSATRIKMAAAAALMAKQYHGVTAKTINQKAA